MTIEPRLLAAVQPHDLLCHPFYQAWSMGTLTRSDLAGYAEQYRRQVEALPSLLRAALRHTGEPALQRNLDEEEGRIGPAHAALWSRFAAAVDARPEEPLAETRASAAALQSLCDEGPVQSLAALWAYELQTARVARTKREGLARYGVGEVAFFTLHEELDVHHAADLLAALERRCGDDAGLQRLACDAAARSAQAQWLFLDGADKRRLV
jgi:pyrroloquinoline-quinone synthase